MSFLTESLAAIILLSYLSIHSTTWFRYFKYDITSLSCFVYYRILLTCIACLSCYSVHLLLRSAGVVGKNKNNSEITNCRHSFNAFVALALLTCRVTAHFRDPCLRATRPQSIRTPRKDFSSRHHNAA